MFNTLISNAHNNNTYQLKLILNKILILISNIMHTASVDVKFPDN